MGDFGLVDTRGDLKIEETLNQSHGDYLLRLAVPQAQ